MNQTAEILLSGHGRWRRIVLLTLALFAADAVVPALAQITQQRVIFPGTANKTTLKGVLLGPVDEARDFIVLVKAGQTLSVTLTTEQTETTHFNVLPPGSNRALFRGQAEGKRSWESQVKLDGEYRVRVFLDRAASRRRESASFEITVSVL
jgi:hypothetical protein